MSEFAKEIKNNKNIFIMCRKKNTSVIYPTAAILSYFQCSNFSILMKNYDLQL